MGVITNQNDLIEAVNQLRVREKRVREATDTIKVTLENNIHLVQENTWLLQRVEELENELDFPHESSPTAEELREFLRITAKY